WGIVLLVTGLYFLKLKPRFFRDWEDRQIKKYMKE
ncbi:MAG: Pr2TM family membrane protein, partial [Arenibacter sp.]|nr:Pr2TM family membrane protein [Arenibacter sp.]